MSLSITTSNSTSFTVTHARHLAAKVATDLKRLQRFYGGVTDTRIQDFETEVTELLKSGYLDTVTYGFKKNDNWIEPTLRYTAKDLSGFGNDDDPGKIKPGLDITGASFHSFLSYSNAWYGLSSSEQTSVKDKLPIKRETGTEPQVLNGYFSDDKTYTSGGVSLGRSTVRSY
ncbi:MAG TPA: hypothetical protein PL131_12625 [Methylotenera sp.]|jgi:hypothetical protein|nr:hypothetical protein [Methylotenera sp.]HPN02102.1 hypothetical protein [Methylotenera sp.]